MFLSKSKHGIWYLWYRNDKGKKAKVSTRCTHKPGALKFLQNFKQDEYTRKQKAKHKLCTEFFSEFLVYADANFSKSTVSIYRYTLKQFFEIVGDKFLYDYTPRDFDFFKTVRQKHIKAVTVNIELRTLKAFFNVAVRWQLLEKSPFNISMVPVPDSSPVYLTREDLEKLLAVVKEAWLKEIIVFAVSTGLRRGELLNLKWSSVDMERKLISIESSPSFKTKSGRKRIVPLNVAAFLILKSRQGKDISEYVFTLNGKRIFPEWITHLFKRYAKKANLSNPDIHFHSLRHTFASWLCQDGVSIYLIKDLMGHANTKTTEIYSHLQTNQLHNEVNKINIKLN
jgi:integrase